MPIKSASTGIRKECLPHPFGQAVELAGEGGKKNLSCGSKVAGREVSENGKERLGGGRKAGGIIDTLDSGRIITVCAVLLGHFAFYLQTGSILSLNISLVIMVWAEIRRKIGIRFCVASCSFSLYYRRLLMEKDVP